MTISENTAPLSPPIEVGEYRPSQGWSGVNPDERARWYCERLELGSILLFPSTPFKLPDDDLEFLLWQKQTGSRFHKNISYRPDRDAIKGAGDNSPDRPRLQQIMRHYSRVVTGFLDSFLLALRRAMETRLRELPPAGGARKEAAASPAQ